MRAPARHALYFTLLLMAFMLIIVVMSLGYDRETRLMPLIVGIPTLLLLGFQVLLQFNASLQARFEIDVFSPSSIGSAKSREQVVKGSLLRHASIIAAYFILIVLFGFLIATPLYLLIFFRSYGHQPWLRCIVGAAIAWVVLYLTFGVAMQYTLFEGILFGGRL
jgi:hypothetical protein